MRSTPSPRSSRKRGPSPDDCNAAEQTRRDQTKCSRHSTPCAALRLHGVHESTAPAKTSGSQRNRNSVWGAERVGSGHVVDHETHVDINGWVSMNAMPLPPRCGDHVAGEPFMVARRLFRLRRPVEPSNEWADEPAILVAGAPTAASQPQSPQALPHERAAADRPPAGAQWAPISSTI